MTINDHTPDNGGDEIATIVDTAIATVPPHPVTAGSLYVVPTARGGHQYAYRAILACPAHRTKARAWAARAGPPTELPAPGAPTPSPQRDPPGQPQLF